MAEGRRCYHGWSDLTVGLHLLQMERRGRRRELTCSAMWCGGRRLRGAPQVRHLCSCFAGQLPGGLLGLLMDGWCMTCRMWSCSQGLGTPPGWTACRLPATSPARSCGRRLLVRHEDALLGLLVWCVLAAKGMENAWCRWHMLQGTVRSGMPTARATLVVLVMARWRTLRGLLVAGGAWWWRQVRLPAWPTNDAVAIFTLCLMRHWPTRRGADASCACGAGGWLRHASDVQREHRRLQRAAVGVQAEAPPPAARGRAIFATAGNRFEALLEDTEAQYEPRFSCNEDGGAPGSAADLELDLGLSLPSPGASPSMRGAPAAPGRKRRAREEGPADVEVEALEAYISGRVDSLPARLEPHPRAGAAGLQRLGCVYTSWRIIIGG